MCHFVLPERGRQAPRGAPGHYGDEAIQALLKEARAQRTRIEDYEFKLFGGGNMFPGIGAPSGSLIGDKNIVFARRHLVGLGARIVAEHSGGEGYRLLMFDLGSGEVWLRHDEGAADAAGRLAASKRPPP